MKTNKGWVMKGLALTAALTVLMLARIAYCSVQIQSFTRETNGSLQLILSEPVVGGQWALVINNAGLNLVEFPCSISTFYLSGQGRVLSGWVYSAVPANTWLVAYLSLDGVGAGCAELWMGPGEEPALTPCNPTAPPPVVHFPPSQYHSLAPQPLTIPADSTIIEDVPFLNLVARVTEVREKGPVGNKTMHVIYNMGAGTMCVVGQDTLDFDEWVVPSPLATEPNRWLYVWTTYGPPPTLIGGPAAPGKESK